MKTHITPPRVSTVVIGAGQTGLAAGYYLAQRGVQFVILEANERVGDSWRKRWDSLRLFTAARFDSLPGMPFPDAWRSFPTKDEMADYLEAYAARFALPVRTSTRVDRLSREGARYVVEAGSLRIEADNVIVAMASYQEPKVPPFASELPSTVRQLHSRDYRNPGQLQPGAVLVVGAGNSGVEIAMDIARMGQGREVLLAGRHPGEIPFDIAGTLGQYLLAPFVLRVLFHRILTIDTPIGRRARAKVLYKGGPLIRTKTRDLDAAGIARVPRVTGVRNGRPELSDGRVLDVANIVWCTGFTPGFSWIDLPIFADDGELAGRGGLVPTEPGLGFIGLHFLYAMSSTMIHGAGRDAKRIVDALAARRIESDTTPTRAARPERGDVKVANR